MSAMRPATVNDDSLKNSLAVSAGIHLLLLLLLYFGLPRLFKPLPEHHVPVPFEIVTLADMTNTRTKEPEPQQKPPEPSPPPKPEVQKPQPQQSTALPQPKPPEPDALAMMPAHKPVPPEPVKPKTDDFNKLLKNLQVKKPDTPKTPTETKPDAKTPAQPATSQATSLSDRLTISEEDALRRQISQCWNMPIGARDAQNLIVEVQIVVNADRTVQSAEVVDKTRMATDSFFRAAAESAIRALYNPRCSPLELPPDKYEQWKSIDFTFDPRDML